MRAIGAEYAAMQTIGVPPLRARMADIVVRLTLLVLLTREFLPGPIVKAGATRSIAFVAFIPNQLRHYCGFETLLHEPYDNECQQNNRRDHSERQRTPEKRRRPVPACND